MDSNEREVQKSLSLLHVYLVTLDIKRQYLALRTKTYIIEAADPDDAEGQAIEKAYDDHGGAVRRNQFKATRITLCERKK